jgi:hypothetical protein
MDIGEAEAGDSTPASVVNPEEEVNALGQGGQRCNRCGGVGHWAKECPTAPGKGLDSVKGGTGGKGYQKGGYQKGYQPKGGKDTVKCENCGKLGHLKTDCWSLKGKGGGKAGINEAAVNGMLAVENIDSCWEISAVNQVKIGNRFNALGDDSDSESEDEGLTVNRNLGEDEEFYDRLRMLFNICPDFGDRINAGEDISSFTDRV